MRAFLPQAHELAADEFIAPPVVTIASSEQAVAAERGGDPVPAQLFTRDDVVEHLPGRSSTDGTGGWWIARSMADALGVAPGDTLWLRTFGNSYPIVGTDQTAAVRIAGTYQDLHEVIDTSYWDPPDPLPEGSPIADYWRPYVERIVRQGPTNIEIRPRMVIAEPETLAAADWGDDFPLAQMHVAYPPAISGNRLDEARLSLSSLDGLEAVLMGADTEGGDGLRPFGSRASRNTYVFLSDVIDYADQTSTLVGAATRPLITAVQIVAFLVVVSAGVYLARLRAGELRLLSSQGFGPRRLAGYTALEMILPALLGGAAGWSLAVLLVRWLGPAPVDSAALLRWTGLAVVAAVAAGLVALWLVTVVLMWAADREAHPWRRANRWRWEIPVIALAAVAGYQAATRGSAIIAGPDGAEVDAFIVAFPLLVLVAAAALVVRGAQFVLPRIRRSPPWDGPSTSSS